MPTNFRQQLNSRVHTLGGKLTDFNGYLIHLPDNTIIAVTTLKQADEEITLIESHAHALNNEVHHANH